MRPIEGIVTCLGVVFITFTLVVFLECYRIDFKPNVTLQRPVTTIPVSIESIVNRSSPRSDGEGE